MKRKSLLILWGVILVAGGCVTSPEEREARRSNAFNLTGEYESVLSDSDVSLNFEILNEEGNHDILIFMGRRGDSLTDTEETFLEELAEKHNISISSEEILRNASNLILGKGHPLIDLRGGENISDNFGRSSKFNVCSKSIKTYKSNLPKEERVMPRSDEVRTDVKLNIYYCLSGTVNSESKEVIVGEFELAATTNYKIKGGKGGVGASSEGAVRLNFRAERLSSSTL